MKQYTQNGKTNKKQNIFEIKKFFYYFELIRVLSHFQLLMDIMMNNWIGNYKSHPQSKQYCMEHNNFRTSFK